MQGEMTCKIEATRQPFSCRNVELGTSVRSKSLKSIDGRLECKRIERNTIADCSKFCEGCRVGSNGQRMAIETVVCGAEAVDVGGLRGDKGLGRVKSNEKVEEKH